MQKAERAPGDKRRLNYPLLGGGAWFPPDGRPNWIWDEFKFRTEQSGWARRPYIESILTWRNAVLDIFDASSFSEIANLNDSDEKVLQADSRFKEAFAQRHRIKIKYSDNDPQPSGIDFGLRLSDTRFGEEKEMNMDQLDDLIEDSLNLAKKTVRHLDDHQIGLLKTVTPERINEPMHWDKPIKHLLALFHEDKRSAQTRYECRRLLSLMDASAEFLLNQDKVKLMEELVENIFDNYLFSPGQIGPQKLSSYIVMRNPKTFAVEGVHFLDDGEKYKASPFVQKYDLTQRKIDRHDGDPYFVQWNEDPKSGEATVLKMLRNDTLDPTDIRDLYRMAVVMNRKDMDEFLYAIKQASHRAGAPIELTETENTLDGDPYQGLEWGQSQKYAASSEKYQVMRIRMTFKNRENLFCELSLYSPEAYANWLHRIGDNTATEIYLVLRQLLDKSADVPPFYYLYPPSVYHIDAQASVDAITRGHAKAIRELAFIPNDRQEEFPINFGEDEISQSVSRITSQIKPHGVKHPQPSDWPKIVVAIGPNSSDAAHRLAKNFDALKLYYDPDFGSDYLQKNINNAIAHWGARGNTVEPNQILFLDDIGEKGETRDLLKSMYTQAKFAFLAVKKGSRVYKEQLADYTGSEVPATHRIIFTAEQIEHLFPHQGVYGLIGKNLNGEYQILIQREKDEEWKLPGGTVIEDTDGGTLDTLRRETGEELGRDLRNIISKNLEDAFPIDVSVPIDRELPKSSANTLHLRGYVSTIENEEIDTDNFIPPRENSSVEEIAWKSLEEAIRILLKQGYKKLILAYYQWLVAHKRVESNENMERLCKEFNLN